MTSKKDARESLSTMNKKIARLVNQLTAARQIRDVGRVRALKRRIVSKAKPAKRECLCDVHGLLVEEAERVQAQLVSREPCPRCGRILMTYWTSL